jgi:hypothetical protein
MEHVKYINSLIDKYSLPYIKECINIEELKDNADFIFQKTYLHICSQIKKAKSKNDNTTLKRLQEIESFFRNTYFNQLPEIQRIAIRHCLTYGKYIIG